MKNRINNYINDLKDNHFFLLLAIVTSLLHATIQMLIYTLFSIIIFYKDPYNDIFKILLFGILIFISPFFLVWIVSYIATLKIIKIKFLNSAISFILNCSIIILLQCMLGSFLLMFFIVF